MGSEMIQITSPDSTSIEMSFSQVTSLQECCWSWKYPPELATDLYQVMPGLLGWSGLVIGFSLTEAPLPDPPQQAETDPKRSQTEPKRTEIKLFRVGRAGCLSG